MCFSFINSPPLLPQGVYQKVYKNYILFGIDFYILLGIPHWGKSGGELMKEKHIDPQNFSTSRQITFDELSS